jgi:hypothetical protein
MSNIRKVLYNQTSITGNTAQKQFFENNKLLLLRVIPATECIRIWRAFAICFDFNTFAANTYALQRRKKKFKSIIFLNTRKIPFILFTFTMENERKT